MGKSIRMQWVKRVSYIYRYRHPDLNGVFTWVLVDNGQQLDFTEIQVQGSAHLAFKAKSGVDTDSASIMAVNVTGDKTGKSLFVS